MQCAMYPIFMMPTFSHTHFLIDCAEYEDLRDKMFRVVEKILRVCEGGKIKETMANKTGQRPHRSCQISGQQHSHFGTLALNFCKLAMTKRKLSSWRNISTKRLEAGC